MTDTRIFIKQAFDAGSEFFSLLSANLLKNIFILKISKKSRKIFSARKNKKLEQDILKKMEELQFDDFHICHSAVVVNQLIDNNISSKMSHIIGLYCGNLFLDNDFLFLPILVFDSKQYDYHSNFIDHAAKVFLKEIRHRYPDNKKSLMGQHFSDVDYEYLLRRAAKKYMMEIKFLINPLGNPTNDIYNAFSSISTMTYEGSDVKGRISLMSTGKALDECDVVFREPIFIADFRAVRKVLELCIDNNSLISDGDMIYGMTSRKIKKSYSVFFRLHNQWEIHQDSKILITVSMGLPVLYSDVLFENNIKANLSDRFEKYSDELVKIIKIACRSLKGALVVVSEEAKEECERLKGQGFDIDSVNTDPKIIKSFFNVDGAVFFSPDGKCHGFGMILDGVASEGGLSSRGARYNSALRYIKSRNKKVLTVVVSEDKIIDFV